MDPAELERLRRLLATLRENRPSKEAERRGLTAYRRKWPAREGQSRADRGKAKPGIRILTLKLGWS